MRQKCNKNSSIVVIPYLDTKNTPNRRRHFFRVFKNGVWVVEIALDQGDVVGFGRQLLG